MLYERYLSLITSEHRGKPKFEKWLIAAFEKVEATYSSGVFWDAAFDLDYAIGNQLDILGDVLGRSRQLDVDITDVYLTWDQEGLGWEQGVWRGPYDPVSALTSLPDDIYRIVLKSKVVANKWKGKIPEAYEAYHIVFESFGGKVIIQDNQDMSMDVGIVGLEPTPLNIALLHLGYLFVKPEGVRINFYMYTPDPNQKLFAWDTQSDRLGGWDEAYWGEEVRSDGGA